MRGIGASDGSRWRLGGISPVLGVAVVFALLLAVSGCAGGGGGGGAASAEDYPSQGIQLLVPADPGGGYDQTGRSIQQALTEGGVVEQNVEVFNVPGGSGTVGLTQFVSDSAGDPHQLMVMGKILVGAIEQTDSPVDLSQTTPIARLTAEYDGIAVPADSEYQTLAQLMEDFQADPGSIAWGGGSVGGVDQILVGQLAQATGVNPADINYIPYSGGGELIPAILSGDVTAGVSGLAEFRAQLESGELRLLAVSSEEPLEEYDAPTIIEAGYDASIANWRGVVAPPEISEEQRQAIIGMMEEMHQTEQWQQELETYNWEDFFLTGEEFEAYIQQEQEDISQVLQELGVAQ